MKYNPTKVHKGRFPTSDKNSTKAICKLGGLIRGLNILFEFQNNNYA
jgi:hypothetical protein